MVIEQLSELTLSVAVLVIVLFPVASNWMVMFLHNAVGLVTSFTLTVAVQVPVLPLGSVAVSVTV